ncbi:MAG: efflux RND transporter periplasmic adaptor subunit [Myxococcota bacterium]|nr:efflux RND transporter periplasmic adaptor subunit [Myxococcota bacterium]
MEPKEEKSRRRRLLGAGLGVVAFALSGVLLLPGLIALRDAGESPTAAVEPDAPDATDGRSVGAALDEPAVTESRAAPPASLDPASVGGSRFFDCMLAPNEVIDVGSPITGLISELHAERSQSVAVGDVLVRLDSEVERAAVAVARSRANRDVDIEAGLASLDLDRKREDRAQRLFDDKALSLDQRQEVEARAQLSAIELDRAREDRRLAALQLNQALATLERRTIRSPIDGIVVERLMSEGEVVDDQTILRIAQVDPLRVEALLPSDWFGRVAPGDAAEVTAEGHADEPRRAEVAIVDRVIDGASGTFGVQLRIDNAEQALPAGLRCQVRFPDPTS